MPKKPAGLCQNHSKRIIYVNDGTSYCIQCLDIFFGDVADLVKLVKTRVTAKPKPPDCQPPPIIDKALGIDKDKIKPFTEEDRDGAEEDFHGSLFSNSNICPECGKPLGPECSHWIREHFQPSPQPVSDPKPIISVDLSQLPKKEKPPEPKPDSAYIPT